MDEFNTNMALDGKAELLTKMRDAMQRIETDFQAKRPATEELLRESQSKQDHILDLLNNRMGQFESEKAALEEEIRGLKEGAEAALAEKEEAEKAAEAARAEKEEAERAAEAARAEKEEAGRAAETARAEKEEAERAAETARAEKEEAEKATEAALSEKEEAARVAEAALGEKAEVEKKLSETDGKIEGLNEQITSLKESLNKSITIAETAVRERNQLQEQLNKFQEHWEKHMAG